MTIKNMADFIDTLWDWKILEGCFGASSISPTDIDGLVERHGKFLLLETKSPNTVIPRGQEVLFDALKRTRLFTIIIVWGKPGNVEELQIWGNPRKLASNEVFRWYVQAWYEWADGCRMKRDRVAEGIKS